jgi:creatinine amidohydrolase
MSASAPTWGRYTELRPDALSAIRDQAPVAYLPWGALEWHGPHLPLGLDGLLAETVAERVAQLVGGVILPTTWWPITALPHRDSLSVRSEVVQALWEDIFAELAKADWQVVVALSGHYAQGHDLMLMDAAEKAMARHGILVLALPPLALVDEEMLDHAALWETAQLLALRPDLVDLDALGEGPLDPKESAVLGRDPRGAATASLGERALSLAVGRLAKAVEQLLLDGSAAPLHALYEQRRLHYRPYIERYLGGSPEEGIIAWWNDLNQKQEKIRPAE